MLAKSFVGSSAQEQTLHRHVCVRSILLLVAVAVRTNVDSCLYARSSSFPIDQHPNAVNGHFRSRIQFPDDQLAQYCSIDFLVSREGTRQRPHVPKQSANQQTLPLQLQTCGRQHTEPRPVEGVATCPNDHVPCCDRLCPGFLMRKCAFL